MPWYMRLHRKNCSDFDYYRAQKVLETMFMFGMISVDEFHKISAVNRKTFSPFLAEIMG